MNGEEMTFARFGRKPPHIRPKDAPVRAACATNRTRNAPHRNSSELYDKIIEFLPDATFVIDRDGRVIAWNRAIEEMTGIGKKEILGKAGYIYALPFYGEPRPILIDLVLAGDVHYEEMYDFTSRKESTLFAEVYSRTIHGGRGAYLWGKASPLFDSDGKIAGAIESIRDITDRKQAEYELRSSRKCLEILFECAPEAMFLVDPDGNLVAANRATEAITGYGRAEVAGKNLFELNLMVRDEIPKALDILENKSMDRPTGPDEFTVIRKDGSRIVVDVKTYPISIANQRLLLGSARDITRRKRAEGALKESESRLRFLSSRLLAAQEEERKRIAGDLHDSIGSYLTGIKLGLENLLQQKDSGASRPDSLRALVAVTQGALEETRRIMTDLRPSILDDLGIVATIGWFCRQCRALYPSLRIEEQVKIEEKGHSNKPEDHPLQDRPGSRQQRGEIQPRQPPAAYPGTIGQRHPTQHRRRRRRVRPGCGGSQVRPP